MTGHRFAKGQIVRAKSGKLYVIHEVRTDDHWKFKVEPGYGVTGWREGRGCFGPYRALRESLIKEVAA